jgi:hypothetical protein
MGLAVGKKPFTCRPASFGYTRIGTLSTKNLRHLSHE